MRALSALARAARLDFLRGYGLRRFLTVCGLRDFLAPPKPLTYWQKREHHVYLQHVFALARFISADARSVLDVGSNGCPYLDWFDWIPRRVSLDRETPYYSPGVESIKADFLTADIHDRFDLCLCLQTIEHVPAAERFSRRLLSVAEHVLISVPYRWPAGREKNHVHDPIDEEKVVRWFGRSPDHQMISTEQNGTQRLICCFKTVGKNAN